MFKNNPNVLHECPIEYQNDSIDDVSLFSSFILLILVIFSPVIVALDSLKNMLRFNK